MTTDAIKKKFAILCSTCTKSKILCVVEFLIFLKLRFLYILLMPSTKSDLNISFLLHKNLDHV